ncbi:uncharacterized protein [Temnothorax nylanderi]|uniref:uncharacterized protein isoform X4 n=1 Tax=Temnothorax nylanderi TaxID=102681 RepID=UPI003A8C09AA
MSSLGNLDLCRLCLVKDRVSVPIFEGEGDVRQIFLKITACLPVKVNREDKLPKKICDDCVYKVELCYQFWHTTANAEKQLLQWLGEVNMEDKQGYNVLNPNGMKEQNNENRLDGTVMQQVSEHQNNMNMGMMDNMGLSMPIMMSSNAQQQITSVPMDNSGSSVQNVQPVAGPSTQTTHDQITQNQTDTPTQQEEEEESSEEEENSDDECDGDEGLPIKEESEEDPNNSRTIEPTTFVNVSLACDEAGPSGLQQQKIADMPEMVMSQTADVDPKTGTKNWSSRTQQKKIAIKKEAQGTSFVILQEIGGKTILVQKVNAYYCDSCNEDFDTEASLIRHRTEQSILRTREALRQAEKKHKCDICGQMFVKELQLIKHRQIHCNPLDIQKKDSLDIQKKYLLDIQKKDSLDIQKKDPLDIQKKYPLDIQIKYPLNIQKKYPLNIQKKQELKKIVTKKKVDKSREENKESENVIKCDQCDKVFKKKRYLNVHKTLHSEPHICNVCGAKLTSDYYLRMHMRRHNKEFTEFCNICNKGFYLKANLKTHMSMHTDQKPCICEICHKTFGNRTYLRIHMKLHSQPETRKKFKCDICSFETFYSYCHKEHMWTHTGESQVACEVCGKLIRRQYMKTHIRIHTGEKPEICEFCGKAFSARVYLIKHRRTHTGEKPYSCKICNKRFTQRGTLSAHLRRHENPE